MPELWLIRHGETEWSLSGAHTGRTDLPLTAEGERRAAALGTLLKGHTFSQVLSSPLARAKETCRIAGLAGTMTVDDDLMEWDYGQYEGLTTAEIRRTVPGWTVWREGVPGGETLAQVAARARRILHRVAFAEGDTALFAHGHFLRVLAACWLSLPPEMGAHLFLSTASLSKLGYERETTVLIGWNQQTSG